MIDDREIWACAQHILQRFGEAAGFHAAQRADALLGEGDLDGHRTWLRILRRINDLESTQPPSPLLN
jgi:hypothetical protein